MSKVLTVSLCLIVLTCCSKSNHQPTAATEGASLVLTSENLSSNSTPSSTEEKLREHLKASRNTRKGVAYSLVFERVRDPLTTYFPGEKSIQEAALFYAVNSGDYAVTPKDLMESGYWPFDTFETADLEKGIFQFNATVDVLLEGPH